MHHHREGYGVVTTMFRDFFFSFLDWLSDIKSKYIYLPKTKDDINHVEELFRLIGNPGCLGSIDCVEVPWRKRTWTLQTQCKNTIKVCPRWCSRWWLPILQESYMSPVFLGGIALTL
jgi:hypothetical protein